MISSSPQIMDYADSHPQTLKNRADTHTTNLAAA
jgi:hypothetical protein